MAMSSRSMPMPSPPEGGIPCSSARRNSSSIAHRLDVAAGGELGLLGEPLALDDRVDELGVAGRQLEAAHVQVPLLDDARDRAVLAHERAGVEREVHDERRAHEVALHEVLPQLLDELAVRGQRRLLDALARGERAQLVERGLRGDRRRPDAADSESYIEMRSHWPPRSYSVPSAHVTVVEPATATAAFWTRSCVRSAMPL